MLGEFLGLLASAQAKAQGREKRAEHMRSLGFSEKEIFLFFAEEDREEARNRAIRERNL